MHKTIMTITVCGGLALSAATPAQVRPERAPPRPVPDFPMPRVTVPLERPGSTVNVGPREMTVVHLARVPESALHVES